MTTDPIDALALTLLHSLWQGLLVGTGLAVLLAGLRKAGPRVRYAVACAALLLMALLPAATLVRQLAALPAASEVPGAISTPPAPAPTAETADVVPPQAAPAAAGIAWPGALSPWLVLCWITGFSLLSVRRARDLHRVRVVTRTGTRPLPRGSGRHASASAAPDGDRATRASPPVGDRAGADADRLGADGPSLSHRVKRIVRSNGGPRVRTGSSSAALVLLATGIVALVVLPGSPLNLAMMGGDTSIHIETDGRADFTDAEGRYKARFDGNRVRLRMKISEPGLRWEFSSTLRTSELERAEDGTYRLRRDAGSFRLEGLTELEGSAFGTFTFVPDPEFAASVEALGYEDVDAGNLFRLTVMDVRLAFLEMVAKYNDDIDLDGVLRLRNHGVSGRYLDELSKTSFETGSVDDVIRLVNHGVSTDYLRKLDDAGFGGKSVSELIDLANHAVHPGFLHDAAESGFRPLTVDEAIRLRTHGVSGSYLQRLARAGAGDLSVEQVVRLANHGADPELFEALSQTGLDRPSPEQVVRLQTQGIGPSYVQGLHEAGLDNLSVEQMVHLRQQGVSTGYVEEIFREADRTYRPEELVRMRQRGVNGDFIRRMVRRGETDLSAERLVRLLELGPSDPVY